MRKYNIHLSLKHDAGVMIEEEKIKRVRQEVFASFGCCAVPYGRAQRYDGVEYVDIVKIEFITPATELPGNALKISKDISKESLQQRNILITTYAIQTI